MVILRNVVEGLITFQQDAFIIEKAGGQEISVWFGFVPLHYIDISCHQPFEYNVQADPCVRTQFRLIFNKSTNLPNRTTDSLQTIISLLVENLGTV